MNSSKETFETWNMLAQPYQDKFMEMDLYQDSYEIFCKLIEKPNARIFEIACGPGNITKQLFSLRPDFSIEAIDLAPNMIELAKKNVPAARFHVMDCKEIDKLPKGFHAIICGFCLPYLSKEECHKLFRDCANLLEEGGVFYFSCIEGDYNQSAYEFSSDGQHRLFIYYHQEDYLMQFLSKHQLKCLQVIRKSYLKSNGTSDTHLIFIAKKQETINLIPS